MPNDSTFLSCDWGTTSFRVRLIQGSILKEYSDSTGCRALYDSNPNYTARRSAFEAHLQRVLGAWPNTRLSSVPLLISGMASSTIGWQEVPYAPLPLNLDASGLRVERIDWTSPPIVGNTFLVSGGASETEMMRGEETEAIGLLHLRPPAPNRTTLILAGTHSKHLTITQGAITEIQTFMTGELFEVLAKHSVFRASIEPASPPDHDAFRAGIDRARSYGLAGSLFQTRTRQVLQKIPPASNASFLSGLLIGAELAELPPASNLLIAGPDSLRNLYAHAATHLGLQRAHIFSAEEVQLAVPIAHELILRRLQNAK